MKRWRRWTAQRLLAEFACGLSMIGLARKYGLSLGKVEAVIRRTRLREPLRRRLVWGRGIE